MNQRRRSFLRRILTHHSCLRWRWPPLQVRQYLLKIQGLQMPVNLLQIVPTWHLSCLTSDHAESRWVTCHHSCCQYCGTLFIGLRRLSHGLQMFCLVELILADYSVCSGLNYPDSALYYFALISILLWHMYSVGCISCRVAIRFWLAKVLDTYFVPFS